MKIIKRTSLPSSLVCVVLISCLVSCKKSETVPTLAITNFSPPSGIIGSSVTINGTNFSATSSANLVKFNGVDAVVTNATSTSLTTTVPISATTGKITVSVNGKTATSSSDFTVLSPAITSFLPTSGIVGTSVTISGNNFDPTAANNVVKFNGIVADVTSATSSELTVTVPETATSGTISVTSGGITVTSGGSFTILEPTITSFSPTLGSSGVTVIITGTNFSTNTAFDIVKINGTVATVTNATSTQITVTVPASATTGIVSVKVGPNTATSDGNFSICSGIELLLSNVAITSSPNTGSTSFNYTFDLTNVGGTQAVLTSGNSGVQAYVSTDNIYNNGNELAASGWGIDATINGGGSVYHGSLSSNIVGGGTVGDHPYLILVFSTTAAITECDNSISHIVIQKIIP